MESQSFFELLFFWLMLLGIILSVYRSTKELLYFLIKKKIQNILQLIGIILLFSFAGATNIHASTVWVKNAQNTSATTSPSPYENNSDDSTSLSIDGATELTVTIQGTLEDPWRGRCYDYVTITDEAGDSQEFCGSIDSTYTVSGSSISISFHSDYSVTESGATVTISSIGNTPPTANDMNERTDINTSVNITLDGDDPDNGPNTPLEYIIVDAPDHGQLTGSGQIVTYTPNDDFSGTDTFTYKTYDGEDYSSIATVTITVANNIDVPICIESITYGKKDDTADSCFNADGIFQGGTGCLQRLKLRNLSEENITSTSILVDYTTFDGTLDNTCGIDKVDETGEDCNVSSSPDEARYIPFRSFEKYDTHTLYLGISEASSGDSPFDGNITIDYIINGELYSGNVEKCQIESEASEDLCYDSIDTSGMMCFSMGDFFSGGLGCTTTINLRNQGDSTLFSPSVDLITNSMFSGHMIDDCGIDGVSGNCSDSDVLDTAFFGMSGMGMGRTLSYDPVPDFDQNETHSTYSSSAMSMQLFTSTTLLGTYVKDGKLYHGEIKECGSCITVFFDRDHYDVQEDINVVGTTEVVHPVIKLSRASETDVTVHYHTEDGTAKVEDGDYVNIDDETITIPAGETNVTISVQVYNDEPIELDEYFFVKLTDPDGACLDDRNTTQINILAQEDSPVCFEDNFDNGLDSKWRVLKADGGFIPEVVSVNGDNRLRITSAENHIATAITKDYEFTTKYNLIIVEFDYYAYGGTDTWSSNGADGIANVLFDSVTGGDSPEPGAMGGSLGYAQKDSSSDGAHPGFQGGWLGLGLDEFGNFINDTEGRNGGIDSSLHPGSIAIRGDGDYSYGTPSTYEQQGYEYLDGVILDSNYPLAKKSSSDYFSGRYRYTVDARDPDHLYIRLERSVTGDPADYEVIIEQFDAKDPQYNQGETPDLVRYAITGSTGGANNIHEISWIKLRGNCAAYGSKSYETGPFDAWDTFRDVQHQKISTKISNSAFNLTLASLDETHENLELKTTSNRVYYGLVRENNDGSEGYTYINDPLDNLPLDFTTQTDYTGTFNIDSAVPDTKVVFRFCADYNSTDGFTLYPPDENCTGQPNIVLWPDEENIVGWREALSSDAFAIRPYKFIVETENISDNIGAGNTFNLILHAVDVNENDVKDYNETVNIWGASPSLDHNDSNPACKTGTLSKVSGSFVDGRAEMALTYNEVGNLKILLTEHNDTDFAHVDLNDTDFNSTIHDSQEHAGSIYRQIETEEVENISFIPDHFKLDSIELHDHHEIADINFTYLASQGILHNQIDPSMTSSLSVDIIAHTALDTVATNYNDTCGYAKNLDSFVIKYQFDTKDANTNPLGLNNILYRWSDDTTNEETGSEALSSSVTITDIPSAVFTDEHNGTAKLTVQFNFDRKYNTPVNPFSFIIDDIDVEDSNGVTDNDSSAQPSNSATYLFARVRPSQYLYDNVVAQSINTPIMVQVYCDRWPATSTNCPTIDLANGQTNEYQWWLSTVHSNSNNDGAITLSPSTGVIEPENVSFMTNGINNNVKVSGNTGDTVDVTFDTTGSNDWLIFNKDSDSVPLPFYRVKFIGESGWTGEGKTGHVVDDDINSKKIRRLEW